MRTLSLSRAAIYGLAGLGGVLLIFGLFRLGSQASAGVTLDDPVVWMEYGTTGELLQLNATTNEVVARVSVGEPGHSLVALPRERDAVFLNRTTGELGVVSGTNLSVEKVDSLVERNPDLFGDDLVLQGDLSAGSDVYVIKDGLIMVVEPGTGNPVPIQTDGIGSTTVDETGRLTAVTSEGTKVGVTDRLQGLLELATLPEPVAENDQLPQVVRGKNGVFVVDGARRTINRLGSDGQLTNSTCMAGSLEAVKIAATGVDDASLEVVAAHDGAAGVLSISEPTRSNCYQIEIAEQGDNFGTPVVLGNLVYLPNLDTGSIIVVDLERRSEVAELNFSFGERHFELEVFDGVVWANEPDGSRAARISGQVLRRATKVRTGTFEDPDGEGGEGSPGTEGDGGSGQGTESGGLNGDLGDGRGSLANEGEGLPPVGDDIDADDELVPGEGLPPVVDPVNFEGQLIANFEFSADTVNVGDEITFSDTSLGNPTSWNWDFDDGTGAEGPEVTKSWGIEGTFTVSLFVADDLGNQSRQSKEITVLAEDSLRAPTADFSFASETVEIGETITFIDQSTGNPETLSWDLGDGTQTLGSTVDHVYRIAGQFTVVLTATNAAGTDTTSAEITVVGSVQAPTAIISGFPSPIEVGQSITLRSDSTNSPTSLRWDFGDGSRALGTEVRHSWAAPGTYTITLTATNSAGTDTAFAQVIVELPITPPVARFGQSDLEAIVGEQLSFNDLSLNNPTTISWAFGDGASASGANVSHSWSEPGVYPVTLTVTNQAGSDEFTKQVTISPIPPDPPQADFSVVSANVPVNSIVVFTDRSTGDPTEWSWDFGDGSTSAAQNPPHVFTAPGSYEVALTASNAGGSTTTTQTIIVNDPPVADFSFVIDELEVSFIDESTNNPTEWNWDFGDGSTSTGENPSHTFATAGTYEITLIASNAAGSSAPFKKTAEVAVAPNANFSFTDDGLQVDFTDTTTNDPTSWAWDFGDGTTSTTQSPSHTFATPGTYPVTLVATNVAGSSTQAVSITVAFAPPDADFNCTASGGSLICDGSDSTGANSYSWSSDPAATVSSGTTTVNPTFTYTTSGNYEITLVVENAGGVTDDRRQTFNVTVPQPPFISSVVVLSNSNGVVQLRANANGSPTSWNWVASGALVTGGNTSEPTLTYSTSGSKTVRVTAMNAVGTSNEEVETFSVTIPPPPTVTGVAPSPTATDGRYELTGSATGSPISWSWSVPGGTLVAGGGTSTPEFTFPSNGTYNLTVTATNAQGTSSVFPFSFDVTNFDPVADFNFAANATPLTIDFTNASTAQAGATYLWNFGDGNTSTLANPQHTYAAPNTYNVTLAVTDVGGSDPIVKSVVVS